jgi:Bardet-Biedl syndrome 1 protein
MATSTPAAPAPANRALWLNAWHDPVASIHTVSSCIRIADVTGDGDPKLLIADQNRTLRMYKGEVKDDSLAPYGAF